MTLRTARLINKAAASLIALSIATAAAFAAMAATGRLEFKFIAVPVMFCFIGITWYASSRLAVRMMEQEEKGDR